MNQSVVGFSTPGCHFGDVLTLKISEELESWQNVLENNDVDNDYQDITLLQNASVEIVSVPSSGRKRKRKWKKQNQSLDGVVNKSDTVFSAPGCHSGDALAARISDQESGQNGLEKNNLGNEYQDITFLQNASMAIVSVLSLGQKRKMCQKKLNMSLAGDVNQSDAVFSTPGCQSGDVLTAKISEDLERGQNGLENSDVVDEYQDIVLLQNANLGIVSVPSSGQKRKCRWKKQNQSLAGDTDEANITSLITSCHSDDVVKAGFSEDLERSGRWLETNDMGGDTHGNTLIENITTGDVSTPILGSEVKRVHDSLPSLHHSLRKLLILDVNGLLVDIVPFVSEQEKYKADKVIAKKAVFKRPFCDDFLEFCFQKFDVGVWSSRTKKNLDKVLDFLMGDSKHQFLFCWAFQGCVGRVENEYRLTEQKKDEEKWNEELFDQRLGVAMPSPCSYAEEEFGG